MGSGDFYHIAFNHPRSLPFFSLNVTPYTLWAWDFQFCHSFMKKTLVKTMLKHPIYPDDFLCPKGMHVVRSSLKTHANLSYKTRETCTTKILKQKTPRQSVGFSVLKYIELSETKFPKPYLMHPYHEERPLHHQ